MEVFISWSGERSHVIANGLREWLPRVIQLLKPWISSADIERGTRWRSEVAGRLEESNVGIFCLTPENQSAPWMLFEAGAISKNPSDTLVRTYLFELTPSEVREPPAQFQATLTGKDETKELVHTINRKLAIGNWAPVLSMTRSLTIRSS